MLDNLLADQASAARPQAKTPVQHPDEQADDPADLSSGEQDEEQG
jgi:hypothetical protein